MSVFIDRDLEVTPHGTRTARSDLSTRLARLSARQPAPRRLNGGDELLGLAAAYPASVWADRAPEQRRTKGASQPGTSQTVFLARELDVATAVFGRRQLRGALETGRGRLVIDCSAVRFIDAAWLGVLVSTARYGAQLGRKVNVGAPSLRVLRVFRMVGLEWLTGDE
jgi:anti-anti-sigma factor